MRVSRWSMLIPAAGYWGEVRPRECPVHDTFCPSDGIVFLQVVALKTNDVPDELLPVLGGHPDEAGVETVGIAQERKRIEPQHLD